jgi:hypothetical protein
LAIALIGTLAVCVHASTFHEIGDAPPLVPGLPTTGVGLLEEIHGALIDSLDVDLYQIDIVAPALFSAAVLPGCEFDAQLFLFSLAGAGVVHNDDAPPGGPSESALTGSFVLVPGSYVLAISGHNRDPEAGPFLPLWLDTPVNVERAPDGPGAFLGGWNGSAIVDDGDYWILLTGCASMTAIPQPAVWDEAADAPDLLPGQGTIGIGPLIAVVGSFIDTLDVDVYCINVTDAASFSAATSGVTFDTQLFLFDANGNGIAHNDDDAIGGTPSSRITNQFVPGNGAYLLAVSSYNRDALGAGLLPVWLDDTVPMERAPDGAGAPGPLGGWSGSGDATVVNYAIALTGAEFCPQLPTAAGATPGALSLRAHPNPFNPSVRLEYSVPRHGDAELRVYDAGGRRVRVLVDRYTRAGVHVATWDGRDDRGERAASGVYFVQLRAAGNQLTTKVVLLK